MKSSPSIAESPLVAEFVDPERSPESLTVNSAFKALWQCDRGHRYRASCNSRTRGTGCPYCSGKAILAGFNDLSTTHRELAQEWADTRPIETVTAGSKYRAMWQCSLGHKWDAPIHKRTARGDGCRYCSNREVLVGFNDLATTHPDIAAEWVDLQKKETEVVAGSAYMARWQCAAGHIWKAKVVWRSRAKAGCPICRNRVVLPGTNDLATTLPLLAAELHDPRFAPEELVAGSGERVRWKCAKSHLWFATVKDRATRGTGCPSCYGHVFVSRGETEVADFIRQILPSELDVQRSVRSLIDGELDIFVPSQNIAVEYNGVFWHSEGAGKDRRYHQKKMAACSAVGIQLIQVWEDDWESRRPIVERMLAHKLGLSALPSVPARVTTAETLTLAETRAFLDENHIQGFASGSYYIGLRRSSGDVVAAMVLKQIGNDLRLERYATSARVPGGQSKLIAYADREIRDWERLITFADRSVSDGGLYLASGWKEDRVLPPDYSYLVGRQRVHKFRYRLKRFRDDPTLIFEDGLSESQLAALNGLSRIWDSGKIRYVLDRAPRPS